MATYTEWMTRLYDGNPQFRKQKLGHIVIPGTHDSGAFTFLVPFAQTQDRNLGEQLEGGIRYLNLRVLWSTDLLNLGFETNTFYLHHERSTSDGMKFEPQLQKIAQFAEKHPKEIIILDVTHLVTFSNVNNDKGEPVPQRMPADIRQKLTDLITNTLRTRIFRYSIHHNPSSCPCVSEIEIGSVVDAGQNIIIISSDLEGDASRFWFWPGSDAYGSWSETSDISRPELKLEQRLWERGWFHGTLTKLLLRRSEEARRHNPEETPPYKGDKDGDKYFDLSRRLFILEFGFSTATILTSAPIVNKAAVEWMKKWERGVEGPGPSGRGATTARQVNVVAFDYYSRVNLATTEDEIFLKTVVEMNERRLPIWRPLGKLQAGISSELAVGRNQNGLPQAFAVGKDGNLWSNWETLDGPWNGWTILSEAPKGVKLRGADGSNRIAVVPNTEGALELFACGSDGNIWHTWQNERNGRWSNTWKSRGGRPFKAVSDIGAGRNRNGLLELFVINEEDHSIYHASQIHPIAENVWHDNWEPLGKPPKGAERLAVSRDYRNVLSVIVLSDSQIKRIRQFEEPNPDVWEKLWRELGPSDHNLSAKAFAVGRNKDGRPETFVVRGGNLWYTRLDFNWENLGAPPDGLHGDQVAVGNHEDGGLVAFAFDRHFRLWRISQTVPPNRWSQWVLVSDSRPNAQGLQVGRTMDGAPMLLTFEGFENSFLWGHEV
jgi:hypothetical protein